MFFVSVAQCSAEMCVRLLKCCRHRISSGFLVGRLVGGCMCVWTIVKERSHKHNSNYIMRINYWNVVVVVGSLVH